MDGGSTEDVWGFTAQQPLGVRVSELFIFPGGGWVFIKDEEEEEDGY